MLTPREKNPVYRQNSPLRKIKSTTLHQGEQRAQHTTNELFRPPPQETGQEATGLVWEWGLCPLCVLWCGDDVVNMHTAGLVFQLNHVDYRAKALKHSAQCPFLRAWKLPDCNSITSKEATQHFVPRSCWCVCCCCFFLMTTSWLYLGHVGVSVAAVSSS